MPIHDWARVEADESGLFHSFHVTWVALMAVRLNEVLPSDFYALPERKAFGWEPDVLMIGGGRDGQANGEPAGEPQPGGLLLETAPPQVELALTGPPATKQRVVAVRREADDRLVSVIEIVSPGNKSSRHGFEAFVDKAVELLERGIHVHVIDLLPPTPRDPRGLHAAIWEAYAAAESPPLAKPLTVAAYVAGDPWRAFVQSVAVGDRLPDMPLFLEPDRYVPAPLEEIYMAAFTGFPRRWRDVLAATVAGGDARGT